MAGEGLRTLVMAKKMNEQSYESFKERHHAASVQLEGRNEAMAVVVAECLEKDLELPGLTTSQEHVGTSEGCGRQDLAADR